MLLSRGGGHWGSLDSLLKSEGSVGLATKMCLLPKIFTFESLEPVNELHYMVKEF